MSFNGGTFVFDGVPCEQYGLLIYGVGSTTTQAQTSFASSEFAEDRISRRYDPLYYGEQYNTPLSFPLTFGLNPKLINDGAYFDRYDFERIASWLVNRDGYKELQINTDGSEYYKYKCKISDLQIVNAGILPQVMTCKVTCDSPFGYMFEKRMVYDRTTSESIVIHSRSTFNKLYYPVIQIALRAGSVSIENLTTGESPLSFTIPAGLAHGTVTVDNLNQIITSSVGDNLYPYCNKKFLGLCRGDNTIKITGNCAVTFICNYPVNVGG